MATEPVVFVLRQEAFKTYDAFCEALALAQAEGWQVVAWAGTAGKPDYRVRLTRIQEQVRE